jgi:hypothetical protein
MNSFFVHDLARERQGDLLKEAELRRIARDAERANAFARRARLGK